MLTAFHRSRAGFSGIQASYATTLEHADRAGKNPSSSQDRAIFRKSRAKGHMAFFLEIGYPSQRLINMVEDA
ncbi:hypothetical protein INT44_007167 [Umbelopsis vinacea]|uniref:Uncharacterized protein n=1 Tax=Umbelopsis vinacea TaxID=44442 RepID=A0A8H7PGK6_9FUNG|nr:hypothetical protein INT44_007167 [Umbelopsis vinacea]